MHDAGFGSAPPPVPNRGPSNALDVSARPRRGRVPWIAGSCTAQSVIFHARGIGAMMIPERPSLERRVLAALEGSSDTGTRIPVLLGGCGTGRTSLLLRLRNLIGHSTSQYIDVERIATTPERFVAALRAASPFESHHQRDDGKANPGARPLSMHRSHFSTARAARAARRSRSCSTNFSSCGRSKAFPVYGPCCATWSECLETSGKIHHDITVNGARPSAAARCTVGIREHPGGAADPGGDPRHAAGRPGAAHDGGNDRGRGRPGARRARRPGRSNRRRPPVVPRA